MSISDVMQQGTGLRLTGNGLDNSITGRKGADTLAGGAGNDGLNGGEGADTMIGGTGDDRYYVDHAGDAVIEYADEGTADIVYSRIDYRLGDHLERLYLQGTDAITAEGNALDNWLYGHGNPAANLLMGGLGNDVYQLGAGDVILEAEGEGIDRACATVDHTLGEHVENLSAYADTGLRLTGNGLDNSIVGARGQDTLDGGAGNDKLNGGLGDDTYRFGRGHGFDIVYENDATAGNADVLQLLDGVSRDQLWFRRAVNSLEISIIGTDDAMSIANWYTGDQHKIEQFQLSDGQRMAYTQVELLVQAMAGIAPPPMGQTTLSPGQQTLLAPVIAQSWF